MVNNNVYASAQNYMGERDRNANIREKMGVATTGLQDLVDIYRRNQKYKKITEALGGSEPIDPSKAEGFGSLPPEAQYGLEQNANDLELLRAGLDVNNIDKFAEVYDSYSSRRPDIAKLISASRIAKIRSDAMAQIANARGKSAETIATQKLIYGKGGNSAALEVQDSVDSDIQTAGAADQAIWGNGGE